MLIIDKTFQYRDVQRLLHPLQCVSFNGHLGLHISICEFVRVKLDFYSTTALNNTSISTSCCLTLSFITQNHRTELVEPSVFSLFWLSTKSFILAARHILLLGQEPTAWVLNTEGSTEVSLLDMQGFPSEAEEL